MPAAVRPESLAVIGLGAIGGSVAWQARLAGVRRVVGYSPERREGVAAVRAAAVTELADSPERAARGAALVILATPPASTLELIDRLAPRLDAGALLSDVASIKAAVVRRAVAAGLADRFAGAHPLAGTHGSGFAHARPDRLRGCVVYVCASGSAAGDNAARGVMGFWRDTLEAAPVLIDPAAHDRQLAWTSHLPQAVAYLLAKLLADRRLGPVSFGSGARDTTRLAASSPDLWIDIFLQNQEPILEALGEAEGQLASLRRLVEARDAAGLRAYLQVAADFRRGLER
ncbi:MAG TPA: prephenate dehydrogenase [Gemmatimonadales bacterium]|nr:prephenate dehydrogenase [Gemmatimonadales bacterium]